MILFRFYLLVYRGSRRLYIKISRVPGSELLQNSGEFDLTRQTCRKFRNETEIGTHSLA